MNARLLLTAFASLLVFAGLILLWKAITGTGLVSPIFLPFTILFDIT